MKDSVDVIVVGGGHNSLTAAGYLAAAGLEVLVLERNATCGGGVVSPEVTKPGFKHDVHSTAHIFIQPNPLIARDELGLIGKFGLEYLTAPCQFTSLFPDGSFLQTFGDLDRSCESIQKFSARDAEAYRAFVRRSEKILPLFCQGLYNPPVPFGTFMAFLEQSAEGREFLGDMLRSCMDIVMELFEHDKVRMHFLRYASEAMMSPETKGTGAILYLMCSFCHKYSCRFPRGGSGELTRSLVQCVEHHGGTIEVNTNVRSATLSGGRITGVTLDDGRMLKARKAVLANVHPRLLGSFLNGHLDENVSRQISKIQNCDLSAMNTHYALREPARFKAGDDLHMSYSIETQPESLEEMRRMYDAYKYGRIPDHLSVLSVCATAHDPSRAPNGMHTNYLYTFMPYELADGGAARWDSIKEQVADRLLEKLREFSVNMGDDNIIARHVDSPLDMERHSSSFLRGDIMGISPTLSQFMGRRPTPELANYAVPGVSGLYLVGPFMHPGGGVIGGGRPVAIKILGDLGVKSKQLTSG